MQIKCLSPGSNRGPLVCETSVITNYTTQTSLDKGIKVFFVIVLSLITSFQFFNLIFSFFIYNLLCLLFSSLFFLYLSIFAYKIHF